MNDIRLLYIDLFCGAGGTSTGVEKASYKGRKCAKVIACVNHDANAIASHAANHPEAQHYTEDMRTLDLRPLEEQAQGIRQAKTTKSERLLSIRLHGTDAKRGYTSGKIADRWQYLIKQPFMVSEQCCECLKKRPFAKYNKQTGEVPILGIMAGESDLRKQQYIRRGGCNSFQNNHIASYPISIWTDADIWAYLRKFKVPYCELYDKGHTRTGCMFCGFGAHIEKISRFELLYDLHPKAYNVFMNYQNNGYTYREALRAIGVQLPDETPRLFTSKDF